MNRALPRSAFTHFSFPLYSHYPLFSIPVIILFILPTSFYFVSPLCSYNSSFSSQPPSCFSRPLSFSSRFSFRLYSSYCFLFHHTFLISLFLRSGHPSLITCFRLVSFSSFIHITCFITAVIIAPSSTPPLVPFTISTRSSLPFCQFLFSVLLDTDLCFIISTCVNSHTLAHTQKKKSHTKAQKSQTHRRKKYCHFTPNQPSPVGYIRRKMKEEKE